MEKEYKNQEGSPDGLSGISVPIFLDYKAEDKLFALIYLLVGYGFIYVFTEACDTWVLSAFTAVYAVVVLLYLWAKERKPPAESWFWLAIMLAVGIPFAFWTVLYTFQILALMAAAAYWTLSATGRLIDNGRTSQWVFFDGWNALGAVPFGNFGCQARVLFGKKEGESEESQGKGRPWGSVLLGFVIAVPALVIILPLLSSADAGFEHLAGNLVRYIQKNLLSVFLRMIFAVPVSCYLYGLVFGGLSGRKIDKMQKNSLEELGRHIRIVPDAAICTALGILCFIYILFIGIQGNYLFSAFTGNIPQDFTYAEYARRGFFELCQIGMWNLILLECAALFSRNKAHKGLSILKILLSVLTLLLVVTAMSKMVMYMSVYGLTVKRILPMVFMIWLVLVFAVIILSQKRTFPAARICIMAGAVLFCLLCVFPVEEWTHMYNEWARMKGWIV